MTPADSAAPTTKRGFSPAITLTAACFATGMLMLDVAVVNTAIAQIGIDLKVGPGSLKWVVDAYALGLAAAVLTFGSLADRFGRRTIFIGGLILFTCASAVCASSQSITTLAVARAVQGLGGAALSASSLALIGDAFPAPVDRSRAMAIYGATIGASFAIGPLVGGALTSGPGWRWIFLVNVPIGIGVLIATLRKVEESRPSTARPIDFPGQITFVAGLTLLVLALVRSNDLGWGSASTLGELGAAAVLLIAFVAIEARSKMPMLPLELFRNRRFTAAQISAISLAASFFAIYFYVTLYLQDVLGLTPIEAGLVYLPGTMLIFVVSAVIARVGAGADPRRMLSGGLVLVAAGMALFALGGANSSWALTIPGSICASLGTGILNPTFVGLSIGSAPRQLSGVASGVITTARQVGIAVGVAGLGALVSVTSVTRHSTHYAHDYHAAAFVAAAIAAVGTVLAWVLLAAPAPATGAAAAAPAEPAPVDAIAG